VFAVNSLGTFNVLEAAKMLGIKRVVNISSSSALGVAWATHPVALQYLPVDEDHPLIPQDAYGLSKLVGEEICKSFHRLTGGDAVSLRYPVIWDAYREPDLLERIAADDASSQNTMWSYIHVDDAARSCRLALEKQGLGAEAFYVSAPETFDRRPSAEIARKHFPQLGEIRGDEQGHWSFLDSARAEQILGFKAEHRWSPK
jgi:nucleoside-diphosphate-sugar epimerase